MLSKQSSCITLSHGLDYDVEPKRHKALSESMIAPHSDAYCVIPPQWFCNAWPLATMRSRCTSKLSDKLIICWNVFVRITRLLDIILFVLNKIIKHLRLNRNCELDPIMKHVSMIHFSLFQGFFFKCFTLCRHYKSYSYYCCGAFDGLAPRLGVSLDSCYKATW